jgi:hypothetical protein
MCKVPAAAYLTGGVSGLQTWAIVHAMCAVSPHASSQQLGLELISMRRRVCVMQLCMYDFPLQRAYIYFHVEIFFGVLCNSAAIFLSSGCLSNGFIRYHQSRFLRFRGSMLALQAQSCACKRPMHVMLSCASCCNGQLQTRMNSGVQCCCCSVLVSHGSLVTAAEICGVGRDCHCHSAFTCSQT